MKAKGRHIAMLSLLQPGHVYPTLGVCSELVRRGHRVTYPTSDLFSQKILETGAEPLAFEVPALMNAEKIRQYPLEDDPRSWQLHSSLFLPLLLPTAAATVAATERFYRENPPDLIVYDWRSYAGRILAKAMRCPAVNMWAHFAHQGFVIRENGVYKNPAPMLGFAHLLDSFMSAHGIEEANNLWHREALNIVFVAKEFQFHAESFDDRFHFVGPCLNRRSQAAWKNNSNGKQILLIAESTWSESSRFLRMCIEAFANSNYHVVFSLGANAWQTETDLLPTNFELNRDAYNLEILPHAAAIICQSGMGITMESLHFGVPIVAVPNHAYNSEVAHRVAELGLGTHLRSSDLSPTFLRASVDAVVTDTGVLEKVKSMKQLVRNCGGAEMAANLIEEALNK